MEKEIINEIKRISELMVLSENTQTSIITWMRRFLQNEEYLIKQSLIKTDDDISKAIKKLKNNEDIGDKLLLKLLNNINWPKISKYVIDNKKLGTEMISDLNKAIKEIYKDPTKETEIISKFNENIDSLSYLDNSPLQLKDGIKTEIKTRIDDGVRILEKNATKVYDIIKAEITSSSIGAKVWSKLKDRQQLQFETFVKSNIILGKERESIQRMANNWMIKHGVIQFFKSRTTWKIGAGALVLFGLYKGYKWIEEAFSGDNGDDEDIVIPD